ncbi:MAG TPA: hypothetical protein VJ875_11515 [Pyrinomonadaceae bacterium]|nr:hypothetical protein [Pyrinomonadaceae bacterium]
MQTILREVPILDLREVSIDAISMIKLVENVKTVVVSTENVEAFMKVPRVNVRSHIIVHPDESLFFGQIEFNDSFLSKLPENTKVVILGHLLMDGFSTSLFNERVQGLRMYGQIFYADKRSVGALLARLERLQGQLLRMQPNAVRWIGEINLTPSKLGSLAGRPVIGIGPLNIDPGLTPEDIKSGISSMVHIGEISGPEESICALFSVCDRHLGTYVVKAEVAQRAALA